MANLLKSAENCVKSAGKRGEFPVNSVKFVENLGKIGRLSGNLGKWVPGVFTYNWRLALAAEPDAILQTVQTTGAKVTFSGLTPRQIYCVQVNAVGAAGPTDFSGSARLMAL